MGSQIRVGTGTDGCKVDVSLVEGSRTEHTGASEQTRSLEKDDNDRKGPNHIAASQSPSLERPGRIWTSFPRQLFGQHLHEFDAA